MKTIKTLLLIFVLFFTIEVANVNATAGTGSISINVNLPPTVTTPTAISITATGATLGANVTSLGFPASISARGTCWGSSPNPATNCTAASGTTTGVYSHARTGMSCGTTYYYRGYATNSTGTGYSPNGTFTTSACGSVPTVTTPTTSSITSTSAVLGANVTSLGVPASISARGTCWGTSANPTTNCTAASGTTTGAFSHTRTGLNPNTIYHFRGYATNATGTGYSADSSFTTPSNIKTPTPTGFVASTSSCGNNWLNLSWNAASGATNYQVFRAGVAAPVYSGSALFFSDTGLTLGQTYSYTLYAMGPNPQSDPATASGTVANACPVTYTVTGTAGANGSISPSSRTVNRGATTTFTVTPNSGYVASASGCGGSLSGNTYTTGAINANCTVTATFSVSSCANGATNPPTCDAFTPTGTLTGSNCTIAQGSSTCNTTLTLSVSHPVSGAATNITKPTNVQVASGLTPASKPNIAVAYPSTTFYLNHNGATLANRTISATCAAGTVWNGSSCVVTSCANGATNPPTCTTFPPCANGATNPPTCDSFPPCANGATNPPSCTIFPSCPNGATNPPACDSFPPCANGATNPPTCDVFTMTGNINATDCTIGEGNSSCSTSLSWSTQNPVGTSAVTTPTSITVRTGNSGSGVSYTVSNGPGNRNFYLYNNGVLLDQDNAIATCATGTVWNGSICEAVLTPIDGGWSSGVCEECDATGHQQCTRVCNNPAPANGGADCPGSTNYIQLCTYGGGENGLLDINFIATPTKIFKGRSATLTWTSNADNCMGDANFSTGPGNPPNGSIVVNPTATTIYRITCSGGTTENKEATVKVSSITVIER